MSLLPPSGESYSSCSSYSFTPWSLLPLSEVLRPHLRLRRGRLVQGTCGLEERRIQRGQPALGCERTAVPGGLSQAHGGEVQGGTGDAGLRRERGQGAGAHQRLGGEGDEGPDQGPATDREC